MRGVVFGQPLPGVGQHGLGNAHHARQRGLHLVGGVGQEFVLEPAHAHQAGVVGFQLHGKLFGPLEGMGEAQGEIKGVGQDEDEDAHRLDHGQGHNVHVEQQVVEFGQGQGQVA